ncbi:MAG: hypothetical protein WBO70_07575 [Erysipelotrichaceae bacterium]
MILKIEFINEDTGNKFVVKNKGIVVMYHDSEIHDKSEYEALTGRVMILDPNEREVINAFYKLAGLVIG